MIRISMREFTHHIGDYMERVRKGERFIVTKRNEPVADILPHNTKKSKPGWSMEMPKLIVKNGLSLSDELIRMRKEERS